MLPAKCIALTRSSDCLLPLICIHIEIIRPGNYQELHLGIIFTGQLTWHNRCMCCWIFYSFLLSLFCKYLYRSAECKVHPASCTDPALLAGSELASSHSTVSKFSSINRQTVLMTPEWFTFTSVGENAFMIFNDKILVQQDQLCLNQRT